MSLFDLFKSLQESSRDKTIHDTVESLKTTVMLQNEAIKELIAIVHQNREGVNELSDLVSFTLQQQAELAEHIDLVESVRQGKMLPSMAKLANTDDDLIN